jgi:hypothetical protein
MPVDKNEAPEGYEAVVYVNCESCAFFNGPCSRLSCNGRDRADGLEVHFIKKERLEKTMEEYEHMTANTLEAWHTVVDAIFRGDCEIKRTAASPEGLRGFSLSVVWDRATHIENGREYRWKKPAQDVFLTDAEDIARGIAAGVVEGRTHRIDWIQPIAFPCTIADAQKMLDGGTIYRIKPGCSLPPKAKKLVDRLPEDFWPLIGIWWIRHKNTGHRGLMIKDHYADQTGIEIAPPGGEWRPMQKEIEVEGE